MRVVPDPSLPLGMQTRTEGPVGRRMSTIIVYARAFSVAGGSFHRGFSQGIGTCGCTTTTGIRVADVPESDRARFRENLECRDVSRRSGVGACAIISGTHCNLPGTLGGDSYRTNRQNAAGRRRIGKHSPQRTQRRIPNHPPRSQRSLRGPFSLITDISAPTLLSELRRYQH